MYLPLGRICSLTGREQMLKRERVTRFLVIDKQMTGGLEF